MTTTTPVSAYRGAGRPDAAGAIERAVDLFAAELGLDPVEVRRRNLVAADAFPFTTPVGTTYDSGDYGAALDLVLRASGYQALRSDQARRRADGVVRQLGIGVSVYVESTAGPVPGTEYAKVELHEDGSVSVLSGTAPQGQGHETSWAMVAAEQLGVALRECGSSPATLTPSPTVGARSGPDRCSSAGSRCTTPPSRRRTGPDAWLRTCSRPARTTSCSTGRGAPSTSAARRVSRRSGPTSLPPPPRGLAGELQWSAAAPTYPFGAHVAVVEVDTETGEVRLLRVVTVDDAGRVVNPAVAEGQRHGGIAQGAAQVLLEEFRYDVDGNPLTTNLVDYPMISAAELPFFELVAMETPTPVNPLGAKGIGESGTIGAIPAVHRRGVRRARALRDPAPGPPCHPGAGVARHPGRARTDSEERGGS